MRRKNYGTVVHSNTSTINRNRNTQGTKNQLELLEKMNVRVSEEQKGFGYVASGLRVYVDQLKGKSGNFEEYVHQIEEIEKQVTEFEAVNSVLDKYVSLLESEVKFMYPRSTILLNQILVFVCLY
ncbi:biogenesis of lysosome-related organelles complex [Salix suchowensis]|nr:biogenesis of lysosome-related organelles complex [Salix suchowensis]